MGNENGMGSVLRNFHILIQQETNNQFNYIIRKCVLCDIIINRIDRRTTKLMRDMYKWICVNVNGDRKKYHLIQIQNSMISNRNSVVENRITAEKESKLFIHRLASHAMWQNKFRFCISGEKNSGSVNEY